MKEMHKARYVGRALSFHALLETTFQHPDLFINQEAL